MQLTRSEAASLPASLNNPFDEFGPFEWTQ